MAITRQKKGESSESLVNCENGSIYSFGGLSIVESPSEIVLTKAEREYLLHVQRGDVASVRRQLDLYESKPEELDRNCTDPLGRSAVAIAVENENLDLLEFLLQNNIKPKDALLHAISEEYVEGVEILLNWEEKHHTFGMPYSWEVMSRDTAKFTKDITPLILAAHHNNYEILKLLLDRGASLPMPHDIRCGCDECLLSTEEDSLRHSLSRINAYRALSSSSLIALSSKDPILTSFELSAELTRLEGLEHEFKTDYTELNKKLMNFVTELLDQVRTKRELSTMLNYEPQGEPWVEGEAHSLERLKQAIRFSQKSFVAHPNVQQMLGAIWYDGLPGFRKKTALAKCLEMAKISFLFPILCLSYIINPDSSRGKFIKKPFVKFICHCASYMFFLMLLALASQRIEYLLIEWFGNAWLHKLLEDWKKRERGSLPGLVETFIVIYVFALIWEEIKRLWIDGLFEYVKDLWNIVDYVTNMLFIAWIFLRGTSWVIVHRDLWWNNEWPWYPREDWDAYDPMLISEGCFGAAMIFSYLKMVNIFSVNPHLGPLQISLGRMIFDILKFFFLYSLVLFAFGCGLNQLMWYYAELEMQKCYHLPGGLPDYYNEKQSCFTWRRFANLFETSQSLFWASFGLVELENFDLTGVGSFTRFWALLMFGTYSVINVIVLLNLLIAMMSNSYMIISERADTEWKFARTKLWLSYFEDGSTVPPPFNIVPSPKGIQKFCGVNEKPVRRSFKDKSRKKTDLAHHNVMRLLVRRYVTEQQRRADEKSVTEDDMNEVKQDISTFRYELIDILKNSGMNTSLANNEDPTVIGKKGRAMERKLMKGFNIGMVEGIFNEVLTEASKPSSFFGKLARAIGKKQKMDWNAKVMRASVRVKDQIGSSEQSLRRSHASIRRRIRFENEQLLKSMNPENIAEYNPNLEHYTPATRVAYAKFKVNTLKQEKERNKKEETEKDLKLKAEEANKELAKTMSEEHKSKYIAPPVMEPSTSKDESNTINEKETALDIKKGNTEANINTKEEEKFVKGQSDKPGEEALDLCSATDDKTENRNEIFQQKTKESSTTSVSSQAVTSSNEIATKASSKQKETAPQKFPQDPIYKKTKSVLMSKSPKAPTKDSSKEQPSAKRPQQSETLKKDHPPTQQGKSKISGQVRTGWL